ncbi:MAG: sugar phosphate isomerase/epimerase [Desulfonauticus sp.]|nr:sugar phosphate isomerase/epimerase [Desulfonauticus sp.]
MSIKFVPLLSTGCLFTLPVKDVAYIAKEAGFKGLEFILNDPAWLDKLEDLKSISQILPIYSIHAPFRDYALWGGHLPAWEKTIALARQLPSVQNITLHPPSFKFGQIGLFWWYVKTKNLPQDLNSPVSLSIENMPVQQTHFLTSKEIKSYLKQCKTKQVKFTFDVCHFGVSGGDILQVFEVMDWNVVSNIHFSDIRGIKEHLFPGQGELPLQKFINLLKNTQFDGFLTLEVGPASLPDKTEDIISKLKGFLAEYLS